MRDRSYTRTECPWLIMPSINGVLFGALTPFNPLKRGIANITSILVTPTNDRRISGHNLAILDLDGKYCSQALTFSLDSLETI
jgi:hypothetical protein